MDLLVNKIWHLSNMKGVLSTSQLWSSMQVLFHLLVDAFVDLLLNILILKTGLNFKETIDICRVGFKEDLFAYHRFLKDLQKEWDA